MQYICNLSNPCEVEIGEVRTPSPKHNFAEETNHSSRHAPDKEKERKQHIVVSERDSVVHFVDVERLLSPLLPRSVLEPTLVQCVQLVIDQPQVL